jgi:hypothetical protein
VLIDTIEANSGMNGQAFPLIVFLGGFDEHVSPVSAMLSLYLTSKMRNISK